MILKSVIDTIWRTLKVAKNPLSILSLKTSESPKPITFRRTNQTYQLTYAQFRVFRDTYPMIKEYSIEQIEGDIFKLSHEQSHVLCASEFTPMMFELMQHFTVKQVDKEFHLKNEKLEISGSLHMLMCLRELLAGEYENDYTNKVVLDVGGFEGESAVYFWSKGAKKIIIYEPVTAHINFLRSNVECNRINAEIHVCGIANKNGQQVFDYDELDPGVGAISKGSKHLEIRVINVADVLEQCKADIAKFDCEGAELSLVNVPTEILRKISFYFIEVHSSEIRRLIIEKFLNSGFCLEKETPKRGGFSVLAFRRKS